MDIKYKVYDEEDKKYLDQDNTLMGTSGNIFYESSISGLYHIKKPTVLQFTGFKDAHEDDIYEGDIVYDEEDEESYGKVVWNEFEGQWRVEYSDVSFPLGDRYHEQLNVVAHYPSTPEEAYNDFLETFRGDNNVKD